MRPLAIQPCFISPRGYLCHPKSMDMVVQLPGVRVSQAPSDLGLVPPARPAIPGSRAESASDLSSLTMDCLMEVIHTEVKRASTATVSNGQPSPPSPSLPPPSISGNVLLQCFGALLVHVSLNVLCSFGVITRLGELISYMYVRQGAQCLGVCLRWCVFVRVYVCVICTWLRFTCTCK